jgi:hypothetical protein
LSVRVPNSTAHVLGAHVDDALEAETRADGRGRDAVLAGARLGDDALLAEAAREDRLAQRVVELVCARVHQVLALEVDALPRGEALGERERRRPARVGHGEPVQFGVETRVDLRCLPAGGQLVERRDEGLRDVAAAVGAEASGRRLGRHLPGGSASSRVRVGARRAREPAP